MWTLDSPGPRKPQNLKHEFGSPDQRSKVVASDWDGCSTAAPSPATAAASQWGTPCPATAQWGTPWEKLGASPERVRKESLSVKEPKRVMSLSSTFNVPFSLATDHPFDHLSKLDFSAFAHASNTWTEAKEGCQSWGAHYGLEEKRNQFIDDAADPWPAVSFSVGAGPSEPLAAAGKVATAEVLQVAPASPKTPAKGRSSEGMSPVAPWAPRKCSIFPPDMYKALRADSVEEVKEVLARDPDAAWNPLWEHNAEPPICVAVRSLCDQEIVHLLLEHKADVEAVDRHGRKPLQLLCDAAETGHDFRMSHLSRLPGAEDGCGASEDWEPWVFPSADERVQKIRDVLLDAGAIQSN